MPWMALTRSISACQSRVIGRVEIGKPERNVGFGRLFAVLPDRPRRQNPCRGTRPVVFWPG